MTYAAAITAQSLQPQDRLAAEGKALQQPDEKKPQELEQTFNQFVGQTFYGQLLSAMRKTTEPPPYFHGGRAEEVFQGQLDQVISERLSESTADQFSSPMFELFQLRRA